MKNLIKFLSICMIAFVAISCGVHTNPTDNITFQQAFNHCLKSTSYIVFAVIGSVLSVLGIAISIRQYVKEAGDGKPVFYAVALGVAVIAVVWLYAPAETAANTTVEQSFRGIYLK